MSAKLTKSIAIITAGIALLALVFGIIFGFNEGMDFSGGYAVSLRQPIEKSLFQLENEIVDMPETLGKIDVLISDTNDLSFVYLIKIQKLSVSVEEFEEILKEKFVTPYGDDAEVAYLYECEKFEPFYGIGKTIMPIVALLTASIASAIYMLIRFGWKSAVSILTSSVISPLIMVSLLVFTRIEVNKPVVSAIYFSSAAAFVLSALAEVISAYRDKTVSIKNNTREEIRKGSADEFIKYVITASIGFVCMFIVGLIWQTRQMRALFIACGFGFAIAVFASYWAIFGLKKSIENK